MKRMEISSFIADMIAVADATWTLYENRELLGGFVAQLADALQVLTGMKPGTVSNTDRKTIQALAAPVASDGAKQVVLHVHGDNARIFVINGNTVDLMRAREEAEQAEAAAPGFTFKPMTAGVQPNDTVSDSVTKEVPLEAQDLNTDPAEISLATVNDPVSRGQAAFEDAGPSPEAAQTGGSERPDTPANPIPKRIIDGLLEDSVDDPPMVSGTAHFMNGAWHVQLFDGSDPLPVRNVPAMPGRSELTAWPVEGHIATLDAKPIGFWISTIGDSR